jgi:uncharacterized protein YkwD
VGTPHPFVAGAAQRGRRLRNALTFGALLIGGLTLPLQALPEAARPVCGAAPSPESVLNMLNAMRAFGAVCHQTGDAAVAAPLRWSANLAAVAEAQSRDMAVLNHMGHRDSQNRNLSERLAAMGYRFSTAAENVAVGYPSLSEVVDAWLESEPHCDNLMNAKVLELGLACSDAGSGGDPGENRYWTLVLGAPPRGR